MANPFQNSIDLVLASAHGGGFRVALIGGFALPFHGVQRATGDVDFLADATGADSLVADLTAAGFAVLHRSTELANLKGSRADLASVDILFAHRPATQAMLARAVAHSGLSLPVVDVEGIIGLKLQAIVNDPRRQRRDEDDIIELLAIHQDEVSLGLLRSYFALFEMENALERYLNEARNRRA